MLHRYTVTTTPKTSYLLTLKHLLIPKAYRILMACPRRHGSNVNMLRDVGDMARPSIDQLVIYTFIQGGRWKWASGYGK